MRGLADLRAIVTGAGGGIGRALVKRLGEEGAVVACFDRTPELAAEAAALAGPRARGYAADIADYAQVERAVAACEAELGPIDALVNNAGWDRVGLFLDSRPAEWDRLIDVNLKGPLNLHRAVLPGMLARKRGRVVTIASDAGRVGSSGEAVYSACKGGVIAFTKTAARELAAAGITLNCVCPGPTDTPLLQSFAGEGEQGQRILEGLKRAIPMRRLGRPDDLPGLVAFLISDDAAYITGQTVSVSGGLTMAG
ncbi:MAG: SDR family oxidoreductase [Alphaproteobacteria bacterium]|nr:SDR family oxidoreductase [Alphaproteobacteria bacterium]